MDALVSMFNYSVYAVRFYSPSDIKTLRMRYVIIKSSKYALQAYIDNFAHELGVPNTITADRVSVFPAYLERLSSSSFGDTYIMFDVSKACGVFANSVPEDYTTIKQGDIAYDVIKGFIETQSQFKIKSDSVFNSDYYCPHCKHKILGNGCYVCKENGYCNFEASYF